MSQLMLDPPLPVHLLEVRTVRLPREVDLQDLDVLDGEERLRAGRLWRASDRAAFVASHAALRRLLADRLGRRPAELRFRREPCPVCEAPRGRPALEAMTRPTIHFSLSRGDGWALVALAEAQVGVDLEAYPADSDAVEIASLLEPGEQARILAQEGGRGERLAQAWTRKEAHLKAVGTGLLHDATYGGVDKVDDCESTGWVVVNVSAPQGHAAAIAVRQP